MVITCGPAENAKSGTDANILGRFSCVFHAILPWAQMGRCQWFFREPGHRILLWFLWLVDLFAECTFRRLGCLHDRTSFDPSHQVSLALQYDLHDKDSEEQTYDDCFHEEALAMVLPGLWNWYVNGRLFPKLMIQPSLRRKRLVEKSYNCLAKENRDDLLPASLWIVGLPRTGSTFLHKLLALDPSGYAPRQWELRTPVSISSEQGNPVTGAGDTRLKECRDLNQATYSVMPKLKHIHNVAADDPDECVIGFTDCAFPEYYLWGCRDMQSAYDWYMRDGAMTEQYENYKKLLHVLCSNYHAKTSGASSSATTKPSHLVLKSPHHTAKLQNIFDVFQQKGIRGGSPPVFIWLHRRLENVVASTCSMNETLNDYTDVHYTSRSTLGKRTLDRLSEVMEAGLQQREQLESSGSPVKFIDIYYDDLVQDPVGVVSRIYQECGLVLSNSFSSHLTRFLEKSNKKRMQRAATQVTSMHKYELADFHINANQVHSKFLKYLDCHGAKLYGRVFPSSGSNTFSSAMKGPPLVCESRGRRRGKTPGGRRGSVASK